MPLLKFPKNHKPRYCGFNIDGILDETLREGAERCIFSIPAQCKIPLISKILQCGIRDIVYGSGPNDPTLLIHTLNELLENDLLPPKTHFSFIMLLNCHEPLMPQFKLFPDLLKSYLTISFGMISHQPNKRLFEHTIEQLNKWGFNNFRVSLLNNFSTGIDEESYENITKDIDRSIGMDIGKIRINDSLGTLYPEATAILTANLRHQYPKTDFCLHAHNDRGLGLQNALTSLYHGFNIIEGGFAGMGNRSGLPAIEILEQIFREQNITINNHDLNTEMVIETARLSERTFLSLPDLYRPISGLIVNQENMGVANIPTFLQAARDIPYFLNSTGLHDATIKKILQDEGFEIEAEDPAIVQKIKKNLDAILIATYPKKHQEFEQIRKDVVQLYASNVIYASTVGSLTRSFLE